MNKAILGSGGMTVGMKAILAKAILGGQNGPGMQSAQIDNNGVMLDGKVLGVAGARVRPADMVGTQKVANGSTAKGGAAVGESKEAAKATTGVGKRNGAATKVGDAIDEAKLWAQAQVANFLAGGAGFNVGFAGAKQ